MIYGQVIYWLTLVSSFLVLLGTIVSFMEKDSPVPTSQLLQSVIDGKSVDQIWQGMGLSPAPDMLFFLANPTVGESMTGFIRRTDLSRDRAEQRSDRFAVGEKVDAVVTNVDKKTRKLTLSIKARETAEEKQAMADFGSSDSGASLGDILGAALAKRDGDDEK